MKSNFRNSVLLFFLLMSCTKLLSQYANTTLSNLTSPTKIKVNLLPNSSNQYSLGNSTKFWKNIYLDSGLYFDAIRFLSAKTGTGVGNTAVGLAALNANTTGRNNTATGFNTLLNNTTGQSNIAIGTQAMSSSITASYNTAIGVYALSNTQADYNTAIGNSSLIYNSTGTRNTSVGYYAMHENIDGEDNTAIGHLALTANTSGIDNVANGGFALTANTTGNGNTSIGESALYSNTTGNSNTATGEEALNAVTTNSDNTANGFFSLNKSKGTGNTAMGSYSLYYNSSGNYNTAVGFNALYYNSTLSGLVAVGNSALTNVNGGSGACTAIGASAGVNNTDGSNNTYVGYHAGNTVTSGSSNTIIGYGADVSANNLNNTTAIGNFAVSNASNRVRIGNSSVTSIGGQVGWSQFSDERIKANIKQDVPGLAFINLLKPVTYNFDLSKEEQIFKRKDAAEWKEKYDIQKVKFTGFLAQQVEAAAKKINYDFSGVDVPANDKDVYGLRYSDFVVPLVKAVQELSTQNDSLKYEIRNLKSEMENIKTMLLSNKLSANNQQVPNSSSAGGSWEEAFPNPFSNSTTINYSLPAKFISAKIIITDKNGNTLKQISLSNNKGSINVDAATLSSGAYEYSLYVDGNLVTSRQMVLSK